MIVYASKWTMRDSCGSTGLDETPQCVGTRRLISRPRKASIFHLRYPKSKLFAILSSTRHLMMGDIFRLYDTPLSYWKRKAFLSYIARRKGVFLFQGSSFASEQAEAVPAESIRQERSRTAAI